jgi:hypothetical protein
VKTLVVAGLLAACGGASSPTPAATPIAIAPASPVAGPAGAPVLGVAELQFFAKDQLVAQLTRDGVFEVLVAAGGKQSWNKIATVRPDGSIEGTDHQLAHMRADGTVIDHDGSTAPFHFAGDVMVYGADHKIGLDPTGSLLLDGAAPTDPAEQLHITGATDPNVRKTALLILALLIAAPEVKPTRPTHAAAP